MKGFKEKGFSDRLSTAAKAKQEQLARARAKSPLNDPEFAKRQAARAEAEAARQARAAEREAQKRAEAEARAARARAEEEARLEALRHEEEAKVRAKRAEMDKLADLLTAQKAARDARYAARKARQK